jgi:hypothetical protein
MDNSFGGNEYLNSLRNKCNIIFIKDLLNPINPFKDIKALFRLYRFLKKNSIDIVHTHSSKAGILGRIAAKLAGVPVIIHTVHGWSFHDKMSKFKKKLYVFLECLASGFCDRMIAVTNLDIEKGLAEGIGNRAKYIIIRSGIDFSKFQNYDSEKVSRFKNMYNGKKIIGTVGRARDAADHATDHVGEKFGAFDVDTGESCRVLIAADGVQAAPEYRVREHDVGHDRQDDQHEHGHGYAEHRTAAGLHKNVRYPGHRHGTGLALALGLSNMAARDLSIDSLFIDEGFGTLDGDTLQMALAVLQGLHAQGKQVGIISHVEGIAPSLGAEVSVEAVEPGRSRVRVRMAL